MVKQNGAGPQKKGDPSMQGEVQAGTHTLVEVADHIRGEAPCSQTTRESYGLT